MITEQSRRQTDDVSDVITDVDAHKRPFYMLLRKGDSCPAKIMNYDATEVEDGAFGGVIIKDVTEFKHAGRVPMNAHTMWFQETYGVSTESMVFKDPAMKGNNEVGWQRLRASKRFNRSIERALLSNMEAVSGDNTTTPDRTRGAIMWLSDTAQSVTGALLPVPASHRPAANYAGTLAAFDETALVEKIRLASEQMQDSIDLQAFLGSKLKTNLDNMSVYVPEKSGNVAARRINWDGKAGMAITRAVSVFQTGAGVVTAHVTYDLYRDPLTGLQTDYSSRSGIFIEPDLWELRAAPAGKPGLFKELEDKGGGARGFIRACLMLVCRTPKGQFRALISADT